MTLFEVGKKDIFPWFFENRLKDINVRLTWVLSIDEDIIWENDNKDIELFN